LFQHTRLINKNKTKKLKLGFFYSAVSQFISTNTLTAH